MDIYEEDGGLDVTKAGAAIAAAGHVGSEVTRVKQLAEINAATLLDIAQSLRTLALESHLAMSDAGVFDVSTQVDEPAGQVIVAFEPGDRVSGVLNSGYEDAVGTVVSVYESEGQQAARVEWTVDDVPGVISAVFTANLRYIDELSTPNIDALSTPDPDVTPERDASDMVDDDIDSDFDGPTSPPDALAALKAKNKKKASKK